MGQVNDLDKFRRPVPKVEVVELPSQEIAVFNDAGRFRDGDILSPTEEKIEAKLPLALRGIDLNNISSRAELMAALTLGLPLNEYQMPKFIYRPDLLDPSLFCGNPADSDNQESRYREMQDCLTAAIIHLNYSEGYAAFEDGRPIWDQMHPFEDGASYSTFLQYIQLPGARQLSLLPSHSTTYYDSSPEMRGALLLHTNYWGLRAKAHDIFAVVHAQRMREQRILKTEDKHFLKAESLFNKLMTFEESLDWEEISKDPKAFVELMEKLTKIQRTALGLSIHGNGQGEGARTPSVEVIMRNVSRQATEGVDLVKREEADVNVQKLLENPEMLERAQELILRFGSQ